MNTIRHDLQTYRKHSVFTQQDIADLIGTMDAVQISKYELADIHPQIELLLLYLILFQLPVDHFFSQYNNTLITRLRLRIPNIIDELNCLEQTTIVQQKIGSLKHILATLNQPAIV